jgi:hypothetical protein
VAEITQACDVAQAGMPARSPRPGRDTAGTAGKMSTLGGFALDIFSLLDLCYNTRDEFAALHDYPWFGYNRNEDCHISGCYEPKERSFLDLPQLLQRTLWIPLQGRLQQVRFLSELF